MELNKKQDFIGYSTVISFCVSKKIIRRNTEIKGVTLKGNSGKTSFEPATSYCLSNRHKKILAKERQRRRPKFFTWCRFRIFTIKQTIKLRKYLYKKKRYAEERKTEDKLKRKLRSNLLRKTKKNKKLRNPKCYLSKDTQTKPISSLKISKNIEYQNNFWNPIIYPKNRYKGKTGKKKSHGIPAFLIWRWVSSKTKCSEQKMNKRKSKRLKRKWKPVNPIRKPGPDFHISSIYFCQKSVGQRSDFHNKLTLISSKYIESRKSTEDEPKSDKKEAKVKQNTIKGKNGKKRKNKNRQTNENSQKKNENYQKKNNVTLRGEQDDKKNQIASVLVEQHKVVIDKLKMNLQSNENIEETNSGFDLWWNCDEHNIGFYDEIKEIEKQLYILNADVNANT